MRKANTAQAAPEATDYRQRAARARDAAGRFIKRRAPAEAEAPQVEPQQGEADKPDPAIAVATVFRASWNALAQVLDADVPDELSDALSDAQGAAYCQLKVVRPTTPEGYRALAECWAIVLNGERGSEPYGQASDHAADSLIAGAGVCVPVRLSKRRILAQVDLASASLNELRTIREKMYALSEVAYGLAAQDCCWDNSPGHPAKHLNTAGQLLHRLADEFITAEDEAGAEMLRRHPPDFWDRRTRLAAVAERVIMNGEDDETAVLIRELQAFAAEQAGH